MNADDLRPVIDLLLRLRDHIRALPVLSSASDKLCWEIGATISDIQRDTDVGEHLAADLDWTAVR